MKVSIGIVGAGITGLAVAYVLSSKYDITIVARDLPGVLDTAWVRSWAGAAFHPQRNFTESQQEMQTTCCKFYWDLAQNEWRQDLPMTEYLDDQSHDKNLWYKTVVPNYRINPKPELPAGVSLGVKYTALAINR